MLRYIAAKPYHVRRVYKTTEHHNPLSGHSWTEFGELSHYEVRSWVGTFKFPIRYGNALKAAIKAVKFARDLESTDRKFPRVLDRQESEWDKAVTLGLDLTGFASELKSES